jgi:hypothetical protein
MCRALGINFILTLAKSYACRLSVHHQKSIVIMGLGDDLQEFENDATGQGGNDGDNNANRP